ncbi:hypothetical protein GALMADRAFT_633343 [Galerina marginata CBS 339.88]|uniref:Uncharacterized protein n=1 Tax=Galerina marginata (strain CBS 339.88) TaxID=685588 RepID=A0A067SS72_GALM3|nr:hypothetical protein GALMADRAFT_633343 [Galerina marginata CBS 339.88]
MEQCPRKCLLANPLLKSFERRAWALTGLVFLTALPGTSVAGLDAVCLQLLPTHRRSTSLACRRAFLVRIYQKPRRIGQMEAQQSFEDPTIVQFDHHVLLRNDYLCRHNTVMYANV